MPDALIEKLRSAKRRTMNFDSDDGSGGFWVEATDGVPWTLDRALIVFIVATAEGFVGESPGWTEASGAGGASTGGFAWSGLPLAALICADF